MTVEHPEYKDSRLVRAVRYSETNWPQMLESVGQIGLAISGTMLGLQASGVAVGPVWIWGLSLGVSVVSVIVGKVVSLKRGDRITKLKERLAQEERTTKEVQASLQRTQDQMQSDYLNLFKGQLSILANDYLQFGDTERISVYKHTGKTFIMLGRYSKNPDYDKPQRTFYPDNQGIIDHAWHYGEGFVDPPLPDPKTDLEGYLERLEKEWKIDKETARSFMMKSRCYWTCVGSVDCLRLRTVRGKESIATNKPCLPTGISPRSYPAG